MGAAECLVRVPFYCREVLLNKSADYLKIGAEAVSEGSYSVFGCLPLRSSLRVSSGDVRFGKCHMVSGDLGALARRPAAFIFLLSTHQLS